MRYRFFTTRKNDYFMKWQFLSEKQIESVVECCSNNDCFYSIQSYNKDKQDKECPLYFDLDGKTAREDAMELVHKIKETLGVFPEVWNSGSKGYHVLVPISIVHPKCEKIALYIASSLNPGPSFDTVVYKSRNLWRIPNTINQKSGKPKIQINDKYHCDLSTLNRDRIKVLVEEAKEQIRLDEERSDIENDLEKIGDFRLDMPPCIEDIIINGTVDGKWNPSLVLLARYFRACNTSKEEAIQYLFAFPHLYYRRTAIKQTFNSIYNSTNKATFGCYSERLLQEKCNKYLCVYCKD